jgi:hypothetical protein
MVDNTRQQEYSQPLVGHGTHNGKLSFILPFYHHQTQAARLTLFPLFTIGDAF